MFTISKKYCCRKMDGNKIFDVSELFRCYSDLFSTFFRCFFSMFSLFMFCLFRVFAVLCFVVLCFVIDPFLSVTYIMYDTLTWLDKTCFFCKGSAGFVLPYIL